MKDGHKSPATQQLFLRQAMLELALDDILFAQRIGCQPAKLKRWLIDDTGHQDYEEMSPAIWNHIREVLAYARKPLVAPVSRARLSKTPRDGAFAAMAFPIGRHQLKSGAVTAKLDGSGI